MRQIEVTYGNQSITLSQSNAVIGMRRKLLRDAQMEGDLAQQLIGWMLYADVIAAAVDNTGFEAWPISRETFTNDLPELFVSELEEAVYELYPHWLPNYNGDQAKKKEKPTPIG